MQGPGMFKAITDVSRVFFKGAGMIKWYNCLKDTGMFIGCRDVERV
jgi:hypothetical protein